jgi:hypothetical protein
MSHHVFSDNFPSECLAELGKYVVSQTGNKRDVLRSLCVSVDYGSQFLLGPAAVASVSYSNLNDAELCSAVNTQLSAENTVGVAGPSLSWNILIPMFIELITRLLK